jgi:7-keto-8-aminopelargonate synthetase-like enzyme
LQLIRESALFKNELWDNIAYMRQGLLDMGFDLKRSEGPIVPIVVGEDSKAVRMQRLLMEKGIFLQAIRPPTVAPGTSRLRLTVVRGLSQTDMDQALEALQQTGKEVGLI